MFSKILIPLDGSKLAEQIICQVEDLAQVHQSEVMLLRVAYFHPFPGADIKEHEEKAIERAQNYLDQVAESMRQKGIKVTTHVRYGEASEEILDHAHRYASVVVLTTHGRGGMLRFAMGSTADRMMRRCKVPLLLVRPEESCKMIS